MFDEIQGPIQDAFESIGTDIMRLIPTVTVALLVIIAGWVIGAFFKKLIIKMFRVLKINNALSSAGVDTFTEKMGFEFKAGFFVGSIVKWFIIAVAFVAALDMLGLTQVAELVKDVLAYLPNVIVAVIILLVASIVANIASVAIMTAMRTAKFAKPELFGKIAYFAIIIFATLASLNQLGIASELVQMLFAGLVFASSLALGLAFGLGGKETASRYLDSISKK